MSRFKLIPSMYLYKGQVVDGHNTNSLILNGNPVDIACKFANNGADELMIIDISEDEETHNQNIMAMVSISDSVEIPLLVGGNINQLEDIKKYLYTGAKKAILDCSKQSNLDMLHAAADRFGSDKIAVMIDEQFDFDKINTLKYDGASLVIANNCAEKVVGKGIKVMAYNGINSYEDIVDFAGNEKIYGISTAALNLDFDYMNFKQQLKNEGIKVTILEGKIPFSKFKLNSDGLIPVVVQDYKTEKVLMVAYMNEEAYNMTIKTGRMTYFSRSRSEIWVKGLTSGHFQYVKELKIDCDYDTILAKVRQIGVPCHTGADTCFFNELVSTDYDDSNPFRVFEDVYKVIQDRKLNPKEGSYTNYLLDKGLDKVLNKLGEETTELIIASKNGEPQSIKYEISDFLYHLMVLMEEKDITWKDITKELSRR